MQPAIPALRVELGRLRAEVRRCRSWQSGGDIFRGVHPPAQTRNTQMPPPGIPCALSCDTQTFAFVCDKAAETFLNDRRLCSTQTASLTRRTPRFSRSRRSKAAEIFPAAAHPPARTRCTQMPRRRLCSAQTASLTRRTLRFSHSRRSKAAEIFPAAAHPSARTRCTQPQKAPPPLQLRQQRGAQHHGCADSLARAEHFAQHQPARQRREHRL